MSLMSNRLFRMAAAPALALASLSSAAVPFAAANAQERPVAAQPVAANTNVAVDPVVFQTLDRRSSSVFGTQGSAAEASRDKIAIVVWGGNRDLQQQAYNAALDLRDQGIPLAFIVGPDLNGVSNDAQFEVYALGAPAFASPAVYGNNYANEVRPALVLAGREAYQTAFPREMASLALR